MMIFANLINKMEISDFYLSILRTKATVKQDIKNTPTKPSMGARILKKPNGEQSPYPTVKKVMALK